MDAVGVGRIDRRWLERRQACEPQIALFEVVFPGGCELSRANLMAAGRAGLDLDWLAGQLLSPPARRAYDEATTAAWRAYREATATVPARRTYQEVAEPARRAYMEAAAPALADALGLDQHAHSHRGPRSARAR